MGCDIHPAIEYKENGKWKAVLVPNPHFGKWEGEAEITASLDINRDYDLFAILGNVRNGNGFAGLDTGDGFDPMSDDRGVPDDISDEAKAALSDEHSATWVTLAEILAYDWDRSTKHRGVVDAVEFASWEVMKEWRPAPQSYCGDVGGGMVRKVTNDEMRELVARTLSGERPRSAEGQKLLSDKLNHYYTKVEWEESYAESAKQLWTKILPKMLNLGRMYGFENVRLVMDFDS